MTVREKLDDAEWEQVTELGGLVLMAASLSDGKVMPSTREVLAGAQALAAGVQRHPGDDLVAAWGDTANAKDAAKSDEGEAKPQSVEQAVEQLVGKIEAAVAVLRAKAPEELDAARDVLGAVATAVVERIGSGFMGSGEKVSESEKAFTDRLAALLA